MVHQLGELSRQPALKVNKWDPLKFPTARTDEKYWVVQTAENEVTVYYAVNFIDETDKALARIIMLEFQTSARNVKNGPNVRFHDKDFPPLVEKAFPDAPK